MHQLHEHPDEGLISYAIRMRNLPKEHPARLDSATYDALMQAAIRQMEREADAVIRALKKAGLDDAML